MEVPGLELKRAQMLQFEGHPLGHLTFLDTNHLPLAFCVIADSDGAAEPRTEQRMGMNVVYWSNASHSFLLIGNLPPGTMEGLADRLRGTLQV
ncbi:hypothetical protein M8R20_15695 [Pseudomonas sp. R2.Fl]|nr:hypothetical protein [Pseudomonas sp. R2.Fl]